MEFNLYTVEDRVGFEIIEDSQRAGLQILYFSFDLSKDVEREAMKNLIQRLGEKLQETEK
jgi:hypothetical protein